MRILPRRNIGALRNAKQAFSDAEPRRVTDIS
jgi:hypothetical protein